MLVLLLSVWGCELPIRHLRLGGGCPYLVISKVSISPYGGTGKYSYSCYDQTGLVIVYLDERLAVGDTIWLGDGRRIHNGE